MNTVEYIKSEVGGEKVEEAWYPLNVEELDLFFGKEEGDVSENEVRESREVEELAKITGESSFSSKFKYKGQEEKHQAHDFTNGTEHT
ncbi:8438_t:CDS:2 [Diversispora eburnea]|uniref:8438_t:CDS:1 n=1 Tax=Diversispora eburnea TaxID=1213867 RepID=A0A9N9A7X7_9GLOM|nr:8438_t:CDS:2 [Diversispora eburnea]